jgi:bifunctional DNase/RNase
MIGPAPAPELAAPRHPLRAALGRVAAVGAAALAPVALLLASVLLVAGTGRASGEDRVELAYAGVVEARAGDGAVLVLRERGGRTILPLVVPHEAVRALRAGARRGPGGPARAGLLPAALAALGARVVEVRLLSADEGPGSAVLRLDRGGRVVELAARPSEVLPAALAAGAPVVVAREVLEAEGLSPEDLGRAKIATGRLETAVRM